MGAIKRDDIITKEALVAPLDLAKNFKTAEDAADDLIKSLSMIVDRGKVSDVNLDIAKSTKKVNDEVKALTESQRQLEQVDKAIAREQNKQSKENIVKQRQLKDLRQETKRLLDEEEKLVGTEEKILKSNKRLREERKKLDQTTAEGAARAKEINEELNRNNEFLKGNTSELEKNRFQVGGYREALEGLGVNLENVAGQAGPVGGFFQRFIGGINGATKAGLRFIATPIGAIIAAIVAGIAALTAVINNNQAASDRFSEIWGGISGIIDEVTSRLIKLASAYLKFITLDFEGALEDASAAFDDLAGSIREAFEAGTELARLQIELEKSTIGATTATAKLRTEIEQLNAVEGDNTKSFREREEASRLAVQKGIELAKIEVDLAKQQLEIINLQVKEAERRGNVFRTLQQEQADAAAAVIEAEGRAIAAQIDGERLLNQVRQDRLERDLDILIDGFDNVKTINEKIINDDTRTLRNREENFARLKELSDISFAEQIATIRKFTDVRFNENELLAESDAKLLNARIRSLGLSEIIEGRLLEIIRERRIVESDFAELQTTLDAARISRLQEIADNEKLLADERISALLEIGNLQMEVLDEQLKQGIINAEEFAAEFIRIQEETADKIAALNIKLFDEDFADREFDLRTEQLNQLTDLNEAFRSGEISSIEEFERRKAEIEEQSRKDRLNEELNYLEDKAALLRNSGQDTSKIESQIAAVRLELSKVTTDQLIAEEKELQEALKALREEVVGSSLAIIDNLAQGRAIQREQELAALEEQKDRELALIQDAQQKEGESDAAFAARQLAIEEQRIQVEQQIANRKEAIERKQREDERRQAIFGKTLAITEIAISTAVAIAKAVRASPITFGLPFSAIAAAIGAAQIAAVATKPIPSFEKGTMFAPEGLAIVNEQGPELITDRHGNRRIIGSDGPTLTYLQGGERIDTFSNTKKIFESENNRSLQVSEGLQMGAFVREIRQGFENLNSTIKKQNRPLDPRHVLEMIRRGETWLQTLKDFQ